MEFNKALITIFAISGFFLIYATPTAFAGARDFEVKVTTNPIGSSYYRHVAFDYDLDLKKLFRYEKRGFGHAEILTLILLSEMTGEPLKNFGNRRLREKITLKTMTEEAGLDYITLYKTVQVIKEKIEKKGDDNLPPPVFLKKNEIVRNEP